MINPSSLKFGHLSYYILFKLVQYSESNISPREETVLSLQLCYDYAKQECFVLEGSAAHLFNCVSYLDNLVAKNFVL